MPFGAQAQWQLTQPEPPFSRGTGPFREPVPPLRTLVFYLPNIEQPPARLIKESAAREDAWRPAHTRSRKIRNATPYPPVK